MFNAESVDSYVVFENIYLYREFMNYCQETDTSKLQDDPNIVKFLVK